MRAATTGCWPTSWRGCSTGARQRERARSWRGNGAPTWWAAAPRSPGPAGRPGPTSRVLQEALAEAGFDPRFRRRSAKTVEITLRECPFRDLLEEHRELVCAVHRGLLEGMLGASRPPMGLDEFEPLAERARVCRRWPAAPERPASTLLGTSNLRRRLKSRPSAGRWSSDSRDGDASERPPTGRRRSVIDATIDARPSSRSSTDGWQSSLTVKAPTCTSRSARPR